MYETHQKQSLKNFQRNDNSTRSVVTAESRLSSTINAGSRMVQQRNAIVEIDNSPRMVSQCMQVAQLGGNFSKPKGSGGSKDSESASDTAPVANAFAGFANLPDEVLLHQIFPNLNDESLRALAKTSKRMRALVDAFLRRNRDSAVNAIPIPKGRRRDEDDDDDNDNGGFHVGGHPAHGFGIPV